MNRKYKQQKLIKAAVYVSVSFEELAFTSSEMYLVHRVSLKDFSSKVEFCTQIKIHIEPCKGHQELWCCLTARAQIAPTCPKQALLIFSSSSSDGLSRKMICILFPSKCLTATRRRFKQTQTDFTSLWFLCVGEEKAFTAFCFHWATFFYVLLVKRITCTNILWEFVPAENGYKRSDSWLQPCSIRSETLIPPTVLKSLIFCSYVVRWSYWSCSWFFFYTPLLAFSTLTGLIWWYGVRRASCADNLLWTL